MRCCNTPYFLVFETYETLTISVEILNFVRLILQTSFYDEENIWIYSGGARVAAWVV